MSVTELAPTLTSEQRAQEWASEDARAFLSVLASMPRPARRYDDATCQALFALKGAKNRDETVHGTLSHTPSLGYWMGKAAGSNLTRGDVVKPEVRSTFVETFKGEFYLSPNETHVYCLKWVTRKVNGVSKRQLAVALVLPLSSVRGLKVAP